MQVGPHDNTVIGFEGLSTSGPACAYLGLAAVALYAGPSSVDAVGTWDLLQRKWDHGVPLRSSGCSSFHRQ